MRIFINRSLWDTRSCFLLSSSRTTVSRIEGRDDKNDGRWTMDATLNGTNANLLSSAGAHQLSCQPQLYRTNSFRLARGEGIVGFNVKKREAMGWRKRLSRARRLHRPDLKDWEQDGLFESFPPFAEGIMNDDSREYEHFIPCNENAPLDIPVVLDAAELKTEEFFEKYEAKEIPCVIKNIPAGFDGGERSKEWPAIGSWSLDALAEDESLRHQLFKCGEDDDGRKIKVKLKYFLSYVHKNQDDSPLYIFDSTFDEDRHAKQLLLDYTVPSYFRDGK